VRSQLGHATGDQTIGDEVEGCDLVVDGSAVAEQHRASIAHRRFECGAGDDEAVDRGHREGDGDTGGEQSQPV